MLGDCHRDYIVDDEAIDVSGITGIPWWWAKVHQRGPRHPIIDLSELDWWDRWRVAWTRIGVHYFIDNVIGAP